MSDPLAGQALNVQELKRIADDKETAKLQEVLARRQKEEDEEKRARQDFMERELRPDGIERFNGWVRRAAEQGRSEIEIMRFPSQYCRDKGRAINNLEAGWPDTLTGLARQVHDAYVHAPAGPGLQDPGADPELPRRRPGRGRDLHRLVDEDRNARSRAMRCGCWQASVRGPPWDRRHRHQPPRPIAAPPASPDAQGRGPNALHVDRCVAEAQVRCPQPVPSGDFGSGGERPKLA